MSDPHDKDADRPRPTRTPEAPGRDVGAPSPGMGAPTARGAGDVSASSADEVAAFTAAVRQLAPRSGQGRGRLIFAMDATMSRQPTWDMALALQADMFLAVEEVGGLDVQLVYFRGAGECRSSRWVSEPAALARLMTSVACQGGYTQIRKVLAHARKEAEHRPVGALVFVGDAMEEDIDDLCGRAGELALHNVPVFLFQEGGDARVATAFKEIARLTRGAHCRFDAGSAAQLKELLTAVAVYAAGGRTALIEMSRGAGGGGARRLIEQMR